MTKMLMALCLAGSAMALIPTEASAVVCARGVVRAGCVSAGGAVVVRRPVAAPRAVVVTPRAVVVAPRRAVVRRPVRY
nr:hypothetical protein [Bosea sp. PAMC 26642]